MAENSNIQWCDHTFNPWIGCTKVSPGCKNCYAETLDKNRFSKTLPGGTKDTPLSHWGKGAPRHRTSASSWKQPLKWEKEAALTVGQGGIFGDVERPRVFCASLADWLDDEVPIEWLSDLLYLVIKCRNLDWLMLTKRPQLWRTRFQEVANHSDIGAMIAQHWLDGNPPPNVWIGTTVEDQKRADERIPHLLSIPAKVRFLSCEPLLEAVELRTVADGRGNHALSLRNPAMNRIHWVITGGESGTGCRPAEIEWFRSLKDQCAAAGVSFFMKQLGGVRDHRGTISHFPEDLRIRQFPTSSRS